MKSARRNILRFSKKKESSTVYRRHSIERFVLFGLAGGTAAGVYVALLWALHSWTEMPNWISTAIALLIGKNVNFLVNRNLAFREHRDRSWFKQYSKYMSSTTVGSALNYMVTLSLLEYVAFTQDRPQLAGVLGVGSGVILNYMANVYFVFSPQSNKPNSKDPQ